ncbi:MAG TPA: outer membrane protein assembly factor BamB [Rhodanobacteraceae bacterium]
MKRIALVAIAALLVLAGCSKKSNIKPPHELVKFTPTTTVTQLWKSRVGGGALDSGVRLRPTYSDGAVYAASPDGTVQAFDAKTGKTLWMHHSRTHGWFGWGDAHRKDAFYAGGPAVAHGLFAVGTLDGHVYALDAKTGKPLWRSTVSAGVISKPAIVGERVVVRTNDGKVFCLDAKTGKQEWVYDQGVVPLLSLRGNGSLLVAKGVVFFGSDSGQLVALRLDNGDKLWNIPLASGEGRTDIDRLDDADGSVLLQGNVLYAAAYHGRITAINGPTAQPLWKHDFSTYVSMAISGNTLVAVDDASDVWAFDTSSGSDMWKQDKLSWRWLSGPAIQGDYVVVGDLQGYLHWMQLGDGKFAARTRLSHDAIRAQPLVVGDVAYVEDVAGHIAAYRIGAGAH